MTADVKAGKAVRLRCPQCRSATVARGRTTADAVLDDHEARYVRREGRWVALDPERCRFSGATLADARDGVTPYARSLISRHADMEATVKALDAAPSPKAELSAQFAHPVGLADVEEMDEDREAELAAARAAAGTEARPVYSSADDPLAIGDAWVGRECTWTGWECECPSRGKSGPRNHFRTRLPGPPPLMEAAGPAPRHPDSGFRIMISRDVEIGYGAEYITVMDECPTWSPTRRSDVLNPHRGLSGTGEPGTSGKPGTEQGSEPETPVRVLDVQHIDSPRHLTGGPLTLYRHAVRVVRSAWTTDPAATEADHVTVGLVGLVQRDGAPVRWWAYWSGPIVKGKPSMRFDGAFWGGWPVKVGELKDLIDGRRAEPPKLDPDAPKVRRAPTKKAATSRRKDWVTT